MSRIRFMLGVALAASALGPAALRAQDDEEQRNPFGPGGRMGVSINALYAAPQEGFKQFVDNGWGLGGGLLVKLDPAGVLALRVDANWINYGNDRTRVPLSPTTGNNQANVLMPPRWPRRRRSCLQRESNLAHVG